MKSVNAKIKTVLKEVNEIRKAFGKKPLTKLSKGVPEKAASCPIANSLGFEDICVDSSISFTIPVGKTEVAIELNLSDDMEAFIGDFDNGDYPELVKRA